MSGIAGIFYLDGRQVEQKELALLTKTLAHRGPDGLHSWHQGNIGIIHCMLETTPGSLNESLPYVDTESGNVITADARIDNRLELHAQLNLPVSAGQIVSDSRLILESYKQWGTECTKNLIGDFAFALWNPRENTMFCARDHMGIKPFYYYYSSEVFVFGSEIKAILSLVESAQGIDKQRILDYLVFYSSDHCSTFYRQVKRLPARHQLMVFGDKLNIQPYWDFSPTKEIRFQKNQDYADAYRELFEQAVSCRLNSNYPIGSFLSGGLDSSSITCVASKLLKQLHNKKLITYSEIFTELPDHLYQKVDERQYMDAVLQKHECQANFIEFNQHGPLRGIDRPGYDEPMPYFNGYLVDQTCKVAQQQGVRVLLDGTDGDTTVSHGYERLYDLGTRYRLIKLLTEAKKITDQNNLPFSILKTVWRYSLRPSIPEFIVGYIKPGEYSKKIFYQHGMGSLLRQDVTKDIDWDLRATMLGNKLSNWQKGRLPQYWTFTSAHQQYIMEMIDSRISNHSIEFRYPFWDRRLMEFCLALPLEQKLSDGFTRVIQRRGMQGILPDTLIKRVGKADLSPQFLVDFTRTAEPFIHKISQHDSPLSAYIYTEKLKEYWLKFKQDPYRQDNMAMDLYLLISLDIWLR